jgi:hypothetical protein
VTWKTALIRSAVALMLVTGVSLALAKDKQKEKTKEPSGEMVDSGSFGIFQGGHRVATETFSIQQGNSGSVVNSDFKTLIGEPAAQSSVLQMSPQGDIRRYEWKEVAPGKSQATVTVNDSFLMERSTDNPQQKPEERPFLLPASTSILDDYFFIHREILIWKYLATACHKGAGTVECPVDQKAQFGVLNPHQRSSMSTLVAFTGRDKIEIGGAERELNRFSLKSEGGEWVLWLDEQFKIIRILIAGDNTEVLRD